MSGAYLLNERSGTLHTFPAYEACNVDAIPAKYRIVDSDSLMAHKAYRRKCSRCFGKVQA